jgi:hypothetical protein
MESSLGLAAMPSDHELRCLTLTPNLNRNLRLVITIKIKIRIKSHRRFMESPHGLSSVHNALEPTGTFNGKPSTINLSTINRFMESAPGEVGY